MLGKCKRKGFNLSCFLRLEPLSGKQCHLFINGRIQGSHWRSWTQLGTELWVSLGCFETQGLWFSLFFSSHSDLEKIYFKYPFKLRSAQVREAGRKDT